jgi:aminoglycoside phosphotransferase (APT) family kinase protein
VDELIARYEERTQQPFGDVRYYRVFVAWKAVAVLEGLYAGYAAGTAVNSNVAEFEGLVPEMVRELRDMLA